MADMVTHTVRQGCLSRLLGSIAGVVVGILMIPGSVIVLAWNEHRTIHRTQGLREAESVVATVPDPFEIDAELEQRLIHTTGTATTEEFLSDADFAIQRKALRLERVVEMYQWVEHKSRRRRETLGGNRETVTTYEYRQEWREGENSARFQEQQGHMNPQPRFISQSQVCFAATLGAFQLVPELVERIDAWKEIPPTAVALEKMAPAVRQQLRLESNGFYYSAGVTGFQAASAGDPQIGDQRIRFRVVEPTVVSVLSKQSGRWLGAFTTSNGESIQAVQVGEVPAAEMFQSLRLENTMIAMLFRGGGWFMACMGFGLIMQPLRILASVVPLFSGLVGAASALVATMLGSCVALSTFAVAWMAVRPIFGISMLLLAVLCILLLIFWPRRTTLPGPPPIPPAYTRLKS